jgi:hypothetical protein
MLTPAMVAPAMRLEQASSAKPGFFVPDFQAGMPIFWTAAKAFAIDRAGICPNAGAL